MRGWFELLLFLFKRKKKGKVIPIFSHFVLWFEFIFPFYSFVVCLQAAHVHIFKEKKKYNVGLVHGCLTPVIKENKIKSPLCWHKIPTKIIFNKKWFQEKWFFFFFLVVATRKWCANNNGSGDGQAEWWQTVCGSSKKLKILLID